MRPARIITAVVFAAAVAVTGCAAHSTAADPSAVPAAPVAAAPASPAPALPTPAPKPVVVVKQPTPAPKPVLANGRHDTYVRQVNTRGDYLVVDVVQVFEGQAAIEAATADGMPRDQAQVMYTYVRNQNPRLRTLPLASDLRVDLLPGDCIESLNHQLAKLIKDARAMNGSRPAYYFTVTVAGGAVHHIVEHRTGNAC
jgi:hypothetical protein